jgi:hypothetical protein
MNFSELIGYANPTQWTITMGIIFLFPFIYLRTLKEVGIASSSGAIASMILVGLFFLNVVIVVFVSFRDFNNYTEKVSHRFVNLRSFGQVMGTFSFAYGGNYVYFHFLI